jgi:hypothetical protein
MTDSQSNNGSMDPNSIIASQSCSNPFQTT